jgi:hypothetical protein
MKRLSFCLALGVFALVAFTGCPGSKYDPTPEKIVSNSNKIREGTKKAVAYGMKQWAIKNPELAKQVATQLVKNIDEVVIPYLDNSQGIAGSVLEAFIQQKMVQGLPADVQNLISSAAVVLDAYLPAPAPDKYLKAWQLGYLKAFLQGVSQGASGYASAELTRDMVLYQKTRGAWFVPTEKNDTWLRK